MDPSNRNTALASALVEELARCGLRRAAVSPGSRSTPLAVALWRHPAIEVKVVIDERSAGFLALGSALGDGLPAAVLCTSGSAAANLHPAVIEADEAGVPLIVLTADRPPELRGIGAGQAIDQLKLYGDAVRWFCEVGTHEADDEGLLHYRAVACRAYATAAGDPRPGPVHLNLAWREPLAPVPVDGQVTATSPIALEGRGERPLTAVARRSAGVDEALLDELAERVAGSPRGLIVAGRQPDPGLAAPIAELGRATGYPILAEPTSQLRCGRHDLSAVISGYDAIARSEDDGLAPELIVRVGELPTSKALRQWLGSLPGLRQLVLDPDGAWKEPTRQAETQVRADPAAVAAGLATRLKAGAASPERSQGRWVERWRSADAAVAAAVEGVLAETGDLSEPGIWRAIGNQLRDGDAVFAASSMPVRDLEAFLTPGREQVRFLSNRGANGIDGLVSTAAGIAWAAGGRTWAVVGDLALIHDLGGLRAARESESLRLVVLDNGGGGIFHFLPQAEAMEHDEFEALLGTPSGIELSEAAHLFGLTCETPADQAGLARALAGDARMVVVKTDRAANLKLHRALTAAAMDALAAPR